MLIIIFSSKEREDHFNAPCLAWPQFQNKRILRGNRHLGKRAISPQYHGYSLHFEGPSSPSGWMCSLAITCLVSVVTVKNQPHRAQSKSQPWQSEKVKASLPWFQSRFPHIPQLNFYHTQKQAYRERMVHEQPDPNMVLRRHRSPAQAPGYRKLALGHICTDRNWLGWWRGPCQLRRPDPAPV